MRSVARHFFSFAALPLLSLLFQVMTSLTSTVVAVGAVDSSLLPVPPAPLPRELMMQPFNRDLVLRAYGNMLKRTTKGTGRHGCWVFNGCMAKPDTTTGPKPRQSVQYRKYRGQRTPLPKKSLDAHILAMIVHRLQDGLGPWVRGDTVSHLCHLPRCIRPEHLRIESMPVNNERNICVLNKACGGRHHGHPACFL